MLIKPKWAAVQTEALGSSAGMSRQGPCLHRQDIKQKHRIYPIPDWAGLDFSLWLVD